MADGDDDDGGWHLNNTINVLIALQLLTYWILRQAYKLGAIISPIL